MSHPLEACFTRNDEKALFDGVAADAARYRKLRTAMMAEPPIEDEVQDWEYALAVAFSTEQFDDVVDALDSVSGVGEQR